MAVTIKNPIIPGFYPDPSICRVGDDFYLVNSSFELYPGIPLFHSKDLMNWEQLCNVMTMENGFHMDQESGAGGVMAPTIRYNNGTFYIINANFAHKGNFIVTAADPAGPWSEPHWLDDVPGIDASIFFDDDGKCYIMGTGNVWDNGAGEMERGIWLAEYDIDNYKMKGEPYCIWNSALRGAASPESPHLYHIGDYYYLMIAEGGTEHYHSVAVARSRELFAFYESNPANPVMTHRMMGTHAVIGNVGHADFVDTPDGKWYAVMLASRTIDGVYKNLGRETYICPVEWEWDWPLFSPETGRLEFEYEATGLPVTEYEPEAAFDDFNDNALTMNWTFWGTPYKKYYELQDSCLKISCVKQDLIKQLQPMVPNPAAEPAQDCFAPFIARREREFNFTASCKMNFWPNAGESAGLAVVQAMNHQLHLERIQEKGKQYIQLVLYTTDYTVPPYMPGFEAKTNRKVLKKAAWEQADAVLSVTGKSEEYTFSYGTSLENMTELCKVDATLINTEQVGCMVGTMVGMYATGHGKDIANQAAFDWFEMR